MKAADMRVPETEIKAAHRNADPKFIDIIDAAAAPTSANFTKPSDKHPTSSKTATASSSANASSPSNA